MLKSFRIQSLFLGSAFAIVSVLGLLVGTIYFESGAIDDSTKIVTRAEETNVETLRAKYFIVQIQQFLTDASLTGEMDSVKEAKENAEGLEKTLDSITEITPELKAQVEEVRKGARDLSSVGLEMVAAYLDHGKAAGDAIMKRKETGLDERSDALAKKMDTLGKEVEAKMVVANKALESSHASMKSFAVTLSLLASAIASFGLMILYRRIRPLEKIVQSLEQQAKSVRSSSERLNETANSLSSAAANQSSAAQETAASLEEITAMVQKTSDNSRRMQQSTESSSRAVDGGKSTVVEMLRSVEEIRSNNQRVGADVDQGNQQVAEIVKVISEIGDKTKVINDIVFQTKLLSFNASVEAARAGEHGKGFAVVAEEVGNLANMSGNAAREISEMLEGGVARVQKILEDNRSRLHSSLSEANHKTEDGSRTAERCGQAFESIVGNVGEVTQAVEEITSAIDEQRKGLDEIGRALMALEKSTQENTLAATSTTETAKGLLGESEKLNGLIVEMRSILTGKMTGSAVVLTPRKLAHFSDGKLRKAA